jgi:hypothetical protein
MFTAVVPAAFSQGVIFQQLDRVYTDFGIPNLCTGSNVAVIWYGTQTTHYLYTLSGDSEVPITLWGYTNNGKGVSPEGIIYNIALSQQYRTFPVDADTLKVSGIQFLSMTTNDPSYPDMQQHTEWLALYHISTQTHEPIGDAVNFWSCSYPGLPSSGNGGCGNGGHCPK